MPPPPPGIVTVIELEPVAVTPAPVKVSLTNDEVNDVVSSTTSIAFPPPPPPETVSQVPSPFKNLSPSALVGAITKPAVPGLVPSVPVKLPYVVSTGTAQVPEPFKNFV
jgi:hypothetical protein